MRRGMRRGIRGLNRSPYILGSVYFAVITVLMTWPLATRLADTTVSRPGDNLYWIWQIGWFEKALFSLPQSPRRAPGLPLLGRARVQGGLRRDAPARLALPFSL